MHEEVGEIFRGLVPADRSDGFPEFFVVLLRELAKGRPVAPSALAAKLDWPLKRVTAVLAQVSSTEYAGEAIVGYGLTLRETPHSFEVDGHHLHTWCALDALMFPALIGKSARVASRCAATGVPISLVAAPDEVRDIEPAGAVVSLVRLSRASDLRSAFCCHVHFFASATSASAWISKHEGAVVVSVEEAFWLGQELVRRLSAGEESRPS